MRQPLLVAVLFPCAVLGADPPAPKDPALAARVKAVDERVAPQV